jgi:hypothetical protein
MDYAAIKALHAGCAALSIGGFALRGGLMLADSPLLGARLARVGLRPRACHGLLHRLGGPDAQPRGPVRAALTVVKTMLPAGS